MMAKAKEILTIILDEKEPLKQIGLLSHVIIIYALTKLQVNIEDTPRTYEELMHVYVNNKLDHGETIWNGLLLTGINISGWCTKHGKIR